MSSEYSAGSPFHAILGRALTDPAYRERLTNTADRDGQAQALSEMGVADPEASLDALNEAVEALETFSQSFGTQNIVGDMKAAS
jgi:hypothetical protein